MGVPYLESVTAVKKKRVIRELAEGKESATQLKVLLQKYSGDDGSLSAEKLVAKILGSFDKTLSVLTSSESVNGGEVSQSQAIYGDNGSPQVGSCNDRGFEDSGESRKRSLLVPTKDRRGCYKRRKNAQARTMVSSRTDDKHAWRKYGQKEILNSKFPRSYFRCSRKYDQGCRAIKQVQRIQESPDLYQTTYIGNHTCRDMMEAPQLVVDSTAAWESFLMNQPEPDPSKAPNEQDHTFSSSTLIIKEEYPKEEKPSDVTGNVETNLWSDLKDFEPTMLASASKMASDNADTMYSCTGSHSTLEMDFGVDSVFGTDSDFHFDESQFI